MEGQGDHISPSWASGNNLAGELKGSNIYRAPAVSRLLHAEDLIFSYFTLTLTLPCKQALQAVSANSRGTNHKGHYVSGSPGLEHSRGPSAIMQIRKLMLRENK